MKDIFGYEQQSQMKKEPSKTQYVDPVEVRPAPYMEVLPDIITPDTPLAHTFRVFNKDTGEVITCVYEICLREGWLCRYSNVYTRSASEVGPLETERLQGNWGIFDSDTTALLDAPVTQPVLLPLHSLLVTRVLNYAEHKELELECKGVMHGVRFNVGRRRFDWYGIPNKFEDPHTMGVCYGNLIEERHVVGDMQVYWLETGRYARVTCTSLDFTLHLGDLPKSPFEEPIITKNWLQLSGPCADEFLTQEDCLQIMRDYLPIEGVPYRELGRVHHPVKV